MKWRIFRWRLLTAVVLGLPVIVIVAAFGFSLPATPFNAKKWKSGNKWSRGAMVQDLIDRRLLVGKSRSEVQDLLGVPDYCGAVTADKRAADAPCTDAKVDWFAYRVVTISRCNFWVCRMEVGFDDTSYRVEGLAVSD